MRALSKTTAVIGLLALAIPTIAAAAQPRAPAAKAPTATAAGGLAGDVRCVLTMVALAQQKDRQEAARMGVYFFAGRINARAPGVDLAATMRAEAAQLDGKALEAEARRCGPMINGGVLTVQNGLNVLRPPGAAQPGAPLPGPPTPAPIAPPPVAAQPH